MNAKDGEIFIHLNKKETKPKILIYEHVIGNTKIQIWKRTQALK